MKLFPLGAKAPLIAVGVGMSALLVGSVAARAIAVSTAPEVVMDAAGFDPRAPLLGHFAQVRLAAPAAWTLPEAEAQALMRAGRAWATLAPGAAEGDWRLVGVSAQRPSAAPGRLVVRVAVAEWGAAFEPEAGSQGASITLDYGVDRIYLPQVQAEAVQTAAAQRTAEGGAELKLVLARLGDGSLAVKGVIVDGARIDIALL